MRIALRLARTKWLRELMAVIAKLYRFQPRAARSGQQKLSRSAQSSMLMKKCGAAANYPSCRGRQFNGKTQSGLTQSRLTTDANSSHCARNNIRIPQLSWDHLGIFEVCPCADLQRQ